MLHPRRRAKRGTFLTALVSGTFPPGLLPCWRRQLRSGTGASSHLGAGSAPKRGRCAGLLQNPPRRDPLRGGLGSLLPSGTVAFDKGQALSKAPVTPRLWITLWTVLPAQNYPEPSVRNFCLYGPRLGVVIHKSPAETREGLSKPS